MVIYDWYMYMYNKKSESTWHAYSIKNTAHHSKTALYIRKINILYM